MNEGRNTPNFTWITSSLPNALGSLIATELSVLLGWSAVMVWLPGEGISESCIRFEPAH